MQVQVKARRAPIPIEALKERLRARLAEAMPEVRASFEPSDIVSRVMSFGSPTPIEIAVERAGAAGGSGGCAEKFAPPFCVSGSFRDIQFGQSLDYPTVQVNVDRERAGAMGNHGAVRPLDRRRHFIKPVYLAELLG